MRRSYLLIALAWLLNASAWFLPAVTGLYGGKIGPTIDGVGAFVMAFSAVIPGNRDAGYYRLLAIVSVLTSLLFVIGSPWVLLRGTPAIKRFSAWVAAIAFFFNAHWYGWDLGLGIGYYFWWSSFAVLSVGFLDLTRRKDTAELTPTHTALLPR
jgi:hypothetical protein